VGRLHCLGIKNYSNAIITEPVWLVLLEQNRELKTFKYGNLIYRYISEAVM
jgi:hypothetical protein